MSVVARARRDAAADGQNRGSEWGFGVGARELDEEEVLVDVEGGGHFVVLLARFSCCRASEPERVRTCLVSDESPYVSTHEVAELYHLPEQERVVIKRTQY